MENINKIAEKLFLSEDDIKNAKIALQNMKEKGYVSNSDFRGQLCESIPGAYDMACDAMGIDRKMFQYHLDNKMVDAESFIYLLNKEYGKRLSKE